MNMTRNLKRVVWSKGMFISPQHFQVQDDFLEDSLQFRMAASSNCNWGLTDLAIDQESLANGAFNLRNCRGVFPDGTPFHIPDSDEPPQSREIAPLFPPAQEELDVYLTLPDRRPRGRNVALLSNEASTRYVAEVKNVVDQTSGQEEKAVQLCAKNFRIAFGGEPLDGTSWIRIARINRSATGTYVLKPNYIPPSLSLEASDHLLLILRRLIETLAGKASALASQRRQKGRSQADFTSGDLGAFWLLHTINSFLPGLKHFWGQRRRHPEKLYTTMLALAGSLTTFSLSEESRNLPEYNHDDLGGCFGALDEKIRELLETAIPSRCVAVPLQLQERSTWHGAIANAEHFRNTQFVLSVAAKMGIDELIKQVPKLVKVSPPAESQRLVRNALPGITLRHLPVPPDGVPVKLNRQYFALNQAGVLWEGMAKSQQVAIFVPEDISAPELELLIVLA
jgi:type VI secretion system protein ImpJ